MYLLLLLAGWSASVSPTGAMTPTAEVRQTDPRSYNGRVLNKGHQPLSGATVLVRGTSNAVSTNADGTFLLSLAPGPHTLVVDYPGCHSVELSVTQPDSTLIIIMTSTLAPRRYR
jgi:CarboxypepD_reg-like domain